MLKKLNTNISNILKKNVAINNFKLNFGSQHLVAIGILNGVLLGFYYELKKILKNIKILKRYNLELFYILKLKYKKIKMHRNLLGLATISLKNYLEISILKKKIALNVKSNV